MKAFKDYDKTQAYTSGGMKLPVGGYVLKILAVKIIDGQNGNSDQMEISYDVAEGDHAEFYKRQYNSQQGEDKKWKGTTRIWLPKDDGTEKDEWTKRRFKTFIVSIEESNDGFHWDWDENKLNGLLVGGVFNDKEWCLNGNTGYFTNLHHFVTAADIRENNFKIPDPTYLKDRPAAPADNGFVNIPAGAPEELPFN